MLKNISNEKTKISAKKQGKIPHTMKSKRGFTLYELIMAMALVAIISVVIVTFTTMASNQLDQTSSRAAFLNSSREIKLSFRDSFAELDTVDSTPATYTVSTENGKKLQINGATLIDLADYSEINVISFDIDKSVNDSTGKILKITLTSITQNTYTFTVTSRTGSTFTKAQ